MRQSKMRQSIAPLKFDFRAALVGGLFLLAGWSAGADDAVVAPALQGRWAGNAHILVSWCQQTNLPIALDIHSDGTVAGKVGDARLRNGWIEPNRGWLGHALSLKTDYIIHGTLRGPIVAAEAIMRPRVSIPLTLSNGVCSGSVATSGTIAGGKKTMILSAAFLKLTRPP
jgi:hypothetical protein